MSTDTADRSELPPYSIQEPLSGYPDWLDPTDNTVIVSKAGNTPHSGRVVHVPDPTADEPAPACDHPWPEAGFRLVEATTYPNREYCNHCPWQQEATDD